VQRPEGPIEETIATSAEQRNEQVLALRVAEALRARGLLLSRLARDEARKPPDRSLGVARRASSADDSMPAKSEHEPERPGAFWFELGPGLVLSPGGLEPLPL